MKAISEIRECRKIADFNSGGAAGERRVDGNDVRCGDDRGEGLGAGPMNYWPTDCVLLEENGATIFSGSNRMAMHKIQARRAVNGVCAVADAK